MLWGYLLRFSTHTFGIATRRILQTLSFPCAYCRLQLLFLAGMTITIGVQATMQFFSRRKNRKVGNTCTIMSPRSLSCRTCSEQLLTRVLPSSLRWTRWHSAQHAQHSRRLQYGNSKHHHALPAGNRFANSSWLRHYPACMHPHAVSMSTHFIPSLLPVGLRLLPVGCWPSHHWLDHHRAVLGGVRLLAAVLRVHPNSAAVLAADTLHVQGAGRAWAQGGERRSCSSSNSNSCSRVHIRHHGHQHDGQRTM